MARRLGRSAPLWPLLALLAAFYAWPLVQIAMLSLGWPAPTLASYERILAVPAYGLVMANTLKISLLVTLACLALGYPTAFLLATTPPRLSRKLLLFVVVPFGTSLLVRNYAWMILLGNNGLINASLLKLGLVERPLPLLYNAFGATVGMAHVLLPYMILVLLTTMRGIDRTYGLAAQSLGARPLRAFLTVFLPLSMPGVAAGSVLVFVMSLGFFVTPALLGGRGGTMISMVIEAQINQLVNWPLGAALSVVLLAVTFALLGLAAWVFGAGRRMREAARC
jgi:ABC-type spermidine/putrescine transport system permease subunit I